jgi:hypothetical protein
MVPWRPLEVFLVVFLSLFLFGSLEKNMKNIILYYMYFPVHTDVNTNTDTSLREFCNIICNNREHRKSEHL